MCALGQQSIKFAILGMCLAGGLFVCGVVLAQHEEPREARKYTVEVVTAYKECLAPNTTTDGIGIPACSPAERMDTLCGFEPDIGRGKMLARVLRQGDIKLKGTLHGLTPGCEDEFLSVVTTVRVTTSGCEGGGSCTSVTFPMPIGACQVRDRKCKIRTSVNELLPGSIQVGDNEGFEVLGCHVTRITGPDAPVQTLTCGLLVK